MINLKFGQNERLEHYDSLNKPIKIKILKELQRNLEKTQHHSRNFKGKAFAHLLVLGLKCEILLLFFVLSFGLCFGCEVWGFSTTKQITDKWRKKISG